MTIVGLTGGIGSGKSTVARMFGELGVHWVDADDVAREVVEPGTPALARIAEHFGDEILTTDGALDRAQLRGIVFEKPEERKWLEGLLHPVIRDELIRQLKSPLSPGPSPAGGEGKVCSRPSAHAGEGKVCSSPYVLLVSPLLLETDQHELVDRIVVIDVPEETQIARTMARDTNSREQVERIIAAQMPRAKRLERADAVIDNDRPMDEVERQVRDLHERLMVDFG
ncbi:MAG: dephospho-CoA kinase [Pseudomonadota bacterium]|uniref:dephospho-CoA kinase n=1 Tax=Marinobacter sp. TaxID=50741 RepID=UPI002E831716|nr:dephospho-CoA kinase [Pseudomonadota bacterium]